MLTASGGPFRGRSVEELHDVTVEQALAHPTWDMGPVVTINSATLVNKGLEVIEAHLLFGIPIDRIEVVVHPTSVVHSMVEFVDGATLVQASPPTMLIPIALGLNWPDRVPDTAPAVDWTRPETWEFFPLDDDAFPAVALAKRAATMGGTAPAVYNAANEVCVEAFRQGRLAFTQIVPTISAVLSRHDVPLTPGTSLTVEDVLAADAWARAEAAGQRPASSVEGIKGGPEGEQPLLRARGRDLLRLDPAVDRAPRARPHDPGQGLRREGDPVLHRLRPDRLEPPARRDRVRREGDPARRLREDRRDAAARAPSSSAR